MGQSVTKSECYDLRNLPADILNKITSESYTVIRTSGKEDPDWMIGTSPFSPTPRAGYHCWEDGFITDMFEDMNGRSGMRVFMTTGWKYKDQHVYSKADLRIDPGDSVPEPESLNCWRANYPGYRTFWPTRLSGEQRDLWFFWLDEQLELARDIHLANSKELEANA